jgi:hypothetical protein
MSTAIMRNHCAIVGLSFILYAFYMLSKQTCTDAESHQNMTDYRTAKKPNKRAVKIKSPKRVIKLLSRF